MEGQVVDLCVVGAGFAGLPVAKVYLQCQPDANVIVLDANATIGGTWARERLYPGLRSNNLLGTFEYPDFPMHAGYNVKRGEHIPGEVLHRYFCDYAAHFGLTNRIRFKTRVTDAERLADDRPDGATWRLLLVTETTLHDDGGSIAVTSQLLAKRLVLATGLTSQAFPTHIKGQEDFAAPVISQPWPEQGLQRLLIHKGEPSEHILTVLGGSKSSYDAVYILASLGYRINWVIRKSGYGPTWMADPHIMIGAKRIWLESLTSTRAFSWLSACIWGDEDGRSWIRVFLHRTKLGRMLVSAFFGKVTAETIKQTGLDAHRTLKPLIPDASIQWFATSLAILNYPTPIHDFITSGQVQIHRQDISHLEQHRIVLEDGTELPSECGLIAGANWSWLPNVTIRPTILHAQLGVASTFYAAEDHETWSSRDNEADDLVLKTLPGLRHTPKKPRDKPLKTDSDAIIVESSETKVPAKMSVDPTPWRLYRFLAPPSLDNTIAFTGYTTNLLGGTRNELAGLWIYAYFHGMLSRVESDPFADASVKQRYLARRFPYGFGNKFPDFVFEQVGWFDVLMRDLGLDSRRKRGGWWLQRKWREIVEPYTVEDYRDVVGEWLKQQDKVGAFKSTHPVA